MEEVEFLSDADLELLTLFVLQIRDERAVYYNTHPSRNPKKLYRDLEAYLSCRVSLVSPAAVC